jgi:hypothetical protein
MYNLTSGTHNVSLGTDAGSRLHAGSANTFSDHSIYIGRESRSLDINTVNEIVIGAYALGNGSNTVTIGRSTITDNYFSGNLHTTSGLRANEIKLTTGATDGYYLRSDVDGNGTWQSVAASQVYKGTWNANTNTPDVTAGTPSAGWYYRCTTAGTYAGTAYSVGDDVIYNGTTWERIPSQGYTLQTATSSVLGGVKIGANIDIASGVISVTNITGNSATATSLQTARNIAGVSFNGAADISLDNLNIANGAGYIDSFTELDPIYTAWNKSDGISITESQISDFGDYETAFSKNTAFNKNFGTTSGTVAQGNDSRINNGQTAFGWGNHATESYLNASDLSGYATESWVTSQNYGSGSGGEENVQSDWNAVSGDSFILNKPSLNFETSFSKNTGFNKNFGTTAGTVAQGNDSRIFNGQAAFNWILQFSESDPVYSDWNKSTGISITESQISDFGSYEPLIGTKGSAFNKDFGTTAGTVAQGNDSRINNGQTAFGWGEQVQSDWNATSGNAFILHKPNLSGYLLNTTDTFTGDLAITNDLNVSGEIQVTDRLFSTGNTLTLQSSGFGGALVLNDASDILTSTFDQVNVENVKATSYSVTALQPSTSSPTQSGVLGQIRYTSTHIEVCTATNTWKKVALNTAEPEVLSGTATVSSNGQTPVVLFTMESGSSYNVYVKGTVGTFFKTASIACLSTTESQVADLNQKTGDSFTFSVVNNQIRMANQQSNHSSFSISWTKTPSF